MKRDNDARLSYALTMVAGLAAAVGCATDGGSGPAPDYTLSLAPLAVTIVQGATGSATVTIARTNFTEAVTLSLGNAPAGVAGSFDQAAPTGATSALTVSVGTTVAPGVYALSVNGNATAGNRSTPLTLTVNAAPANYALTLAPAAVTIVQGATGSTTVTIARTNFSEAVTLSLGNAPAGVAWSFDQAAPTGATSALTVSVGTTVAPGVYTLSVNGNATAGNRSTLLTLTVNSAGGVGNVTTVETGTGYSCSLDASGQAHCWGLNHWYQLGAASTETCVDQYQNSLSCSTRPLAVSGGLTFTALSSGNWHSCGVTTSGTAYCWGDNGNGEFGIGNNTGPEQCGAGGACSRTPVAVAGGLSFAAVSAGYGYTCGVTTSGAAYCWGGPAGNGQIYGQLGDGTTTQRLVPTAVAGGLTFAAVSTGLWHTCGVTTSGAAYCWGRNHNGQLGDGTSTDRLVPTPVAGGLTFAAVSAGYGYTCGVTTNRASYCWGWNGYGQLGDGTTTARTIPTPVAGGYSFAVVSAGYYHTCGVTISGPAYCWGDNGYGQLGDGTTTARTIPTPVVGGYSFAVVSAANGVSFRGHTCGVTTESVAYCWGLNSLGELGDGTTTQRLVPTTVGFP